MPRGEQVARFYALAMDLAASKRGKTAAALAETHNLTRRTVYRDLHALEDAGFPITTGEAGRWRLVDGWDKRIPFPVPADQLVALTVARRLTGALAGTPFAEALEALHRKLLGRGGVAPISEGIGVWTSSSNRAIDFGQHRETIATLQAACEQRRTVRASYFSHSRNTTETRDIDPYCLHYDNQLGALYTFAYCRIRNDVRTFAVQRFRATALTDRRFRVPSSFSADDYLRGAFRIWRESRIVNVDILLDSDAARWITERQWHPSQRMEWRKDGRCVLSLSVDPSLELRQFVRQLGPDAEVLAPTWLRDEIAGEVKRMAARYARRPAKGVLRKRLSLDDTGVVQDCTRTESPGPRGAVTKPRA